MIIGNRQKYRILQSSIVWLFILSECCLKWGQYFFFALKMFNFFVSVDLILCIISWMDRSDRNQISASRQQWNVIKELSNVSFFWMFEKSRVMVYKSRFNSWCLHARKSLQKWPKCLLFLGSSPFPIELGEFSTDFVQIWICCSWLYNLPLKGAIFSKFVVLGLSLGSWKISSFQLIQVLFQTSNLNPKISSDVDSKSNFV